MSVPFVSHFIFTLEQLFASMCFTKNVPKRSRFLLRLILCIVATFVVSAPMNLPGQSLLKDQSSFYNGIMFFLSIVIAILILIVCFRCNAKTYIYLFLAGNCTRMCAFFLFRTVAAVLMAFGWPEPEFHGGRLLHYLILLPIIAIVYVILRYMFSRESATKSVSEYRWSDSLPFAISLLVNLIFNAVDERLMALGMVNYGLTMLSFFLMYAVLLISTYLMRAYSKSREQVAVMQQLWQEKKHQYEQTKESIDIINMKCHDLRHQLRMVEGKLLDSDFAGELEKALYIYDSHLDTGNETLDIIVSDKMLLCEAKKIPLTVMASAARLSFMRTSDIVSLFSNLLENAMEYEETIEDPEQRFIALSVYPRGGFLSISVENAFEGTVQLRDGFPVSSKGDHDYHGFGLRSIYYIAGQYGGQADIAAEDGCFRVTILFPLEEKAAE